MTLGTYRILQRLNLAWMRATAFYTQDAYDAAVCAAHRERYLTALDEVYSRATP